MNAIENRLAKAYVAFVRSEGFSLTEDQRESLIDQLALAIADIVGEHKANYQAFHDACLIGE